MWLSNTVTKNRKIYGNWKVYSPDGELMFRCDNKKAKWYLSRNLAEYINTNQEIKLKFKPKGLGNHNKVYGLDEMLNICVNCGGDEFLTRHHIVPYCYRKFFPLELKSHQSHDILSMCSSCHEDYEVKSFKLKESLSVQYGVPINGNIIDNKEFIKIVKKANCLNSDIKNSIPKERLKTISNDIKDYFGWKRLTKSRLRKLVNQDIRYHRKTNGELIVEKINDFNEFTKMWRKHFLDNNKCEFLPKNWSIDYE